MSFLSIGDLAQSFRARRQVTDLKSALQRHAAELTTGQHARPLQALRGDVSGWAAIEAGRSRAAAQGLAIAEARSFADGQQAVLSRLVDAAADSARGLLPLRDGAQPAAVDAAARAARVALDGAVAALNQRLADRSLFAGSASGGPALASATEIVAALAAATAGADSAATLEAAVAAWFDTPGGGFEADAYRGGAAAAGPFRLGEGEIVTARATASDPALRATLQALAMAALIDEGALAGQTRERAAALGRAGERLMETQGGLVALAAEVGGLQARIDSAGTRNRTELAALDIARQDLLGVDPYEAATRLEDSRARMDTLFTLTARLSRLSLSEYLR